MERIWYKHYTKGMPHEINPDEFASLGDLFKDTCKRYANHVAYEHLGVTLTYAQVYELSLDFAAYLSEDLGLKKGDRLAIMMPNTLQYPIAMFAALQLGIIVVNVNPLYKPRELKEQLLSTETEAIVIIDMFAKTLSKVLGEVPIKHIVVTSLPDLFPHVKRHLVQWTLKYFYHLIPSWRLPHFVTFRNALSLGELKRDAHESIFSEKVMSDDIAFLQSTGGTTGGLKSAILTHRNMVANTLQTGRAFQPFITLGAEVSAMALPLYHIFSLTTSGLMCFFLGAKSIVITNPRDIKGLIKQIRHKKISIFFGVNTLFNGILHHRHAKSIDFSHLKFAIAGGMALQHDVSHHWKTLTGKPLLEGYGLTEASPVVCCDPLDLDDFHSSIGVPLPSTDVCILNEAHEPVPQGEVGELVVKGPQVMKGYWKNPEETANIFTKDGWLLTGDMAYMDEEGFIYLKERKKDVIIVSGFNVYPSEVEDILTEHEAVLEAAVIGVDDAKSTERVKAFVVLDGKAVTKKALIRWCKKHLTGYKVPKEIEFIEALPKTPVGKILRKDLR